MKVHHYDSRNTAMEVDYKKKITRERCIEIARGASMNGKYPKATAFLSDDEIRGEWVEFENGIPVSASSVELLNY